MSVIFTIDGMQWTVPCKIERTAEMKPSEISGMLLDKSWFNDVLGTYMRYDVTIAVPLGMESVYAAIYEKLTEPVDGHSFVLPYNNGTVTVTGRVTNVRDVWRRTAGGGNYWAGTAFTVIANHPTKTMSLSQVLARGFSPLPEASEALTGASFQYTSEGWTVIPDANDVAY